MFIYVAGIGTMAHAMAEECRRQDVDYMLGDKAPEQSRTDVVVIHVGGRQRLLRVIELCRKTRWPLIHAASGLDDCLPSIENFVVVKAPNLALSVVAFLEMMPNLRAQARKSGITTRITVSHQLSKGTPPGTAHAIAELLDVSPSVIEKLETRESQLAFGVQPEHLDRHSHHHVRLFQDSVCSIELKIRVNGLEEYAEGGLEIARALGARHGNLDPGYYSVPFILGWNE